MQLIAKSARMLFPNSVMTPMARKTQLIGSGGADG